MGSKSRHSGHGNNRSSTSSKDKGKNVMCDNYENLSKEELRSLLLKKGLQTTGKKQVLVKRLVKFERSQLTSTVLPQTMTDTWQSNASTSRRSVGGHSNGSSKNPRVKSSQTQLNNERKERESLVLWRRPFYTLYYFICEVLFLCRKYILKCINYRWRFLPLILLIGSILFLRGRDGVHKEIFMIFESKLITAVYWLGLGILSSIGLGTGLHTFLLYLGPHIAQTGDAGTVSMWDIVSKVRFEAFMWGAGTAIGELPPYFMARAAKLSGSEVEEEEELEALEEIEKSSNSKKLLIPNPLFDLAGIVCGHFLVPFWTFFGATVLGKAVIKMHFQKFFVIIIFNAFYLEYLLSLLGSIPKLGPKIQPLFRDMLEKQKEKLHRKPGDHSVLSEATWVAFIFEKFVLLMVIYFVISIVNSFAQSYHKRFNETKLHNKD